MSTPVEEHLDVISAQLADLSRTVAAERLERERWGELVHELNSVAGAGMGTLSDTLAAAQERGYFSAGRYAAATVDRMVASVNAPAAATTPGTMALLRRLREPEVRRGLARALDLLHAMGAVSPTTPAKD